MKFLVKCKEEEYASFVTYPVRRRTGWRWVPFYFRGPALSTLIGPLLTLLGIWRFARAPRRIADLPGEYYCGGTITRISQNIGSYGMGSPGFLGMKCRKEQQSFWIILVLWSASRWITIDGYLPEAIFPGDQKRIYRERGRTPIEKILGAEILSVEFAAVSVKITVRSIAAVHVIELRRDGASTPKWGGSGGKRKLMPDESLEDAVVISRKGNLWLDA